MELIYRFMGNFMLGMFILLFYQKIMNIKPIKIVCSLSVPLAFATYMLFVLPYMIEPFRSIFGMFILGLLIWIWQRAINWAALTLAFLVGYFFWITSIFIAMAISLPLGITSPIAFVVTLFAEALVYVSAYKLIKLKHGVPPINEGEAKGIIFAVAGIVLTFSGVYHTTIHSVYEENRPLFYSVIVSFALVVVALVFLIIHLHKKHREKMAANQLKEEYSKLEAEFGQMEAELEALATKHHKYKEVVPAVRVSSGALMDLLRHVNDENRLAYLEKMKKNLTAVNQMTSELSEEFAIEELDNAVKRLLLPEEWMPLEMRLRQVIQQSEQKGIHIYIKNTAATWNTLPVSIVQFTRLVGNLLSNAVKELEKTDGAGKQVTIQFSDHNGSFEVEFRDNAHEFPVKILARLGERKNSTNGTGDGYAEIFEILAASNASFEIVEKQARGRSYKTIRVVFDGNAGRVILTDYRFELLRDALANTDFLIEE